jgi:hypothetical protein
MDSLAVVYVSQLSRKRHEIRENALITKWIFRCSLQILPSTFLDLWKIKRNIIINPLMYSWKVSEIYVWFNQISIFSADFNRLFQYKFLQWGSSCSMKKTFRQAWRSVQSPFAKVNTLSYGDNTWERYNGLIRVPCLVVLRKGT